MKTGRMQSGSSPFRCTERAFSPAASISREEREARTLEANARRGVSASNIAAAPAAPVSKATTSRGRVSLDLERGYSPGGARVQQVREAASRAPAAEKKTPDYRRMVELNRMEGDLNRAWRQNAAFRSPDAPPDYSRMPSSRLAVLRNQAQIDLDTDTLNQINQVFKTRRAARGQQTAAGRIALSAIGEGGEEVVEDLFQPFLKRAVYAPNAKFDAGEAWNDFTVGAILGGLGGGVEAVGNMGSTPAGNQAGIGRGAEAQAAAAPETARGGGLEAEPMRVGRVTAIKRPYQGQTPVQAPMMLRYFQIPTAIAHTNSMR